MKTKALRFISLVVICAFIITTCKKDEKVTDLEITDVTVSGNTVTVNGKVISLSGNKNSDYGVCYAIKNTSPVITDTVVRLGQPKVGTFTAEIKDLKRNKTYYFRGFIKEGDAYLYDNVRTALITAIPPVATSKAATGMAETAVTLNGSVNANGSSTTVSFEYGTTAAYGSTVAATQNILSGSTLTDVSVGLTALTPNTTYHFRVKAVNAAGTVTGEDLTFTTLANVAAPSATSTAATIITNTTASINGSVNANGSNTTISFEYGTTFLYGSSSAATPSTASGITPVTVTSALTGLTPGQLYHFRIKAVSAGGTSYGEDLTFTTTQPPTIITQAATNTTLNSATLNGQANANGLSSTVTFEYGTTTDYGTTVNGVPDNVTGTSNTAITAAISGLSGNTTYHFRIKAVSSAGSVNGEDLTFTTQASAVAPTATTSAATSVTNTTASVNGSVNANGSTTAVSFEYGTTFLYGSSIDAIPATVSGITPVTVAASLTGLIPGQLYHFRLKAVSAGGTIYGEDLVFTTLNPPAAVTTSAIMIYPTTATLSGYVNGHSFTTSIKFQYGTTTSYGTTLFGIPDNATGSADVYSIVNLSGLTKNTLYHYRIVAENAEGLTNGNDMTFTTLENDPVVPTLTTKTITNITFESAIGGGIISSNGGAEVTARGICYSTNPGPTLDDFRTANGEGTGEYSSPFTGLPPSTLYYVRAYATNMIGTAYGNEVTFTTAAPPAEFATVSTVSVSGITYSSAVSGGNITNDGGGSITSKGVCWSTSEYPTTADSKSSDGTGTGIYASTLAGLSANTMYFVRAYAINSAGTSYGDQITFTTSDPPAGLAVLTTTAGSDITTSTFTSGGNITNDGGGSVTARGVCYSTSPGPTVSGSKTIDGDGTGIFVSNVSGLLPSTQYYVRAYATNLAGTAYGNQITVTTSAPAPVLPTVTTSVVNTITYNSGTGGGNVTNEGNTTVTVRGVCWNTSPGPTTDNTKTTNGTGSGTFTSSITGLNYSTLYYVRAYATNSVGTAYGNEVTFTTSVLPWVIPTVTTTAASSVTSSGASTGGNISSDGGGTVTARGVCYGTSSNPTLSGNFTTNGTGTGIFTDNLTGLSASTLYYVRAYATNTAGTAYGNQITFTTDAIAGAPVLSTTPAYGIASTSASGGGNISNDGDGAGSVTITARGVCWSTSANPTTALITKTSDGTGTGTFTSAISGLTPCTSYHVRAYATNSAGFTSYGADEIFVTSSVLATVVTTALSSQTSTSVSTGGTVSGDCASTVTERGVCWGTTTSPTTSGSKLTNGTGSGSYIISITGLTPCTAYYIRAYSINASGTQYGNELSFTTSAVQASATTTAASSVTTTSATSGGTISGNCTTGATRGICYATTSNPTIANSVINSGTGAGTYSIPITGLTPCTTYYVRAFVTNSAGTAYGTQISFTTSVSLPTVTTTAVSSIAAFSAVSGGSVSGNCTSGITARGVCWSTASGPHVGLATKTVQTGTSGSFTSNITGLSRVTTYYVRAYATNSAGTSYGNEISFTTLPVLPTVSTSSIGTIITGSGATGGGNVTDEGGVSVTARGVCWSTSSNPTVDLTTKTVDATGAGAFTSSISGLNPGTTYYVRAYATNTAGTGYGINRYFTTPANVTDNDGNVYGAVSISGNVWMQSNLRVKSWANAPIGGGSDTSQMVALPQWWQYNDNSTYGTRFGLMYNWSAVTSSYNICPTGWHVPSQTEWSTFASSLGGYTVAASTITQLSALERSGNIFFRVYYWTTSITGHDNTSLFYARGGGYYSGAYAGLLDNTRWWTSTSQRYIRIQYNNTYLDGVASSLTAPAADAYYIRCKRD